jgi:hypothetical protein
VPVALAVTYKLLTEGEWFVALGYFPLFVGFFWLVYALRALARWGKFGRSHFRMETLPGRVGGVAAAPHSCQCGKMPSSIRLPALGSPRIYRSRALATVK